MGVIPVCSGRTMIIPGLDFNLDHPRVFGAY